MSAVTAVPLRPLARGSVLKLWIVLALLVAAAAGLAWWDTRRLQIVTYPSGVRVQTLREGNGPGMTVADVVALRFQVHVNSVDGPLAGDSGAEPLVGTVQDLPPWLAEGLQTMRERGRYVVWVPVRNLLNGQPVPPTARFTADDMFAVETQILQIDPGQASTFQMRRIQQVMQQQQQQQQMQQQGGPGGPPPGAGPGGRPGLRPQAPPAGGR